MSRFLREFTQECRIPKFSKLFFSYAVALITMGYLFPLILDFLTAESNRRNDKSLTKLYNLIKILSYGFSAIIGLLCLYHCYLVINRIRTRCKIIKAMTRHRTEQERPAHLEQRIRRGFQKPEGQQPQPLQLQVSSDSLSLRTQSTMLSSSSHTLFSESYSEVESPTVHSSSATESRSYALKIEPQTPQRRYQRILERNQTLSSQTSAL